MSGNPYEKIDLIEWWDSLTPTFVSSCFIVFVFILAGIYYCVPKKKRWIVLLAGSISFYLIAGIEALGIIVLTSVIVWGGGICIGGTSKAQISKRRFYLFSIIVVLLGMLTFVKLHSLFEWDFDIVIPLGLSYYTFSAIGYLADVYWCKEQPERNVFKMALFLLFYPKILQGPIAKYKNLAPQLNEGNDFDYVKFCYGIQLAIWGYFKKMVIADRIAIVTSTVFGDYKNYGGSLLFLAMMLAALQLYCDFSGCMDIASGVSQMFGIGLEQNFDHPFFAKNGAEFWQRWHMTLSGWFRDYLFLPISRSTRVKRISKMMGSKYGPTARKSTIILISSFFVWLATGLWHGTGLPYVVWGLYWYLIINTSMLLEHRFQNWKRKWGIEDTNHGWKIFCMIRTYLIFSFGRLLTIPDDLMASWEIFKSFFMRLNIWELFDGTIYTIGLTWQKFAVLKLAIAILWIVEILQTKMSIRKWIASRSFAFRVLVYDIAILFILIYGVYGLGAGNTTFLYINF